MAAVVVPIATWVAGTVSQAALALGITGQVGGYLTVAAYTATELALYAGLSFAIDAVTRPEIKPPGSELQLNIDPAYPREMIIGERQIGGSLVARYSRDVNNYFAHVVIQVADHPCVELSKIYDGGRLVQDTPLAHGVRTEITSYSNSGGPRLWMTWHDGRPGQTADSDLVTKSATDPEVVAGKIDAWTSDHKGAGCAYVHIEIRWDPDILTSIPQFTFLVKGARLYDRRKDTTAGGAGAHRLNDPSTWEYSTNAMVALDHFLLGYKVESDPLAFGVGLSHVEVPYAQFAAAADLCDEDVETGVGGAVETIKRYAANGVISAGDYFQEVIEAFQVQMAARVVDLGGRIGILGAEERAITVSLTEDDLISGEPLQFADKLDFADLIGSVTGTFSDPANNYQPTPYDPLYTQYQALPDGGEAQAITLTLPYEVHPRRAARLVSAYAARETLQPRLAAVFNPKAWTLEAGDWFEFTSPRLQVEAAKFEVVDIVKNDDFTVIITARAIDPNFLAFDNDNDPDLSVPPDIAPYERKLATPTFTPSASTISGGGAVEPVISITNGTLSVVAREIVYEVREWTGSAFTGPSIFFVAHADETVSLLRQGIKPGAKYKVRMKVRAGTRESDWSDWSSAVTIGTTYTVPTAGAANAASAGSALEAAIAAAGTSSDSAAAAAAASAATAATAASNAATARTAAQTAQTAAETALAGSEAAKLAAAASQSAASASASGASGSATAASGYATTASTAATNAATAQSAAATSATSAATANTAAQAAKTVAQTAETNAAAAQSAAATSASAAATAATNAATAQSAAATSATSAATQATNAAASALIASGAATAASGSATAAAGSATSASNFATTAGGSATAAASSATAAAASATAASGSASAASTSASAASTSATNAGTSASAAAASAVTASTQASNAATSASAAATSASSAASSQTAAGTSASAAATSATNASTSAGAASTSATNASNSATTAAGHAATASTQATNAANSATAAGGSATAASGSASTATTQATNASNSATAAAASAVTAASQAANATTSATAAATSATTATTQATNAASSASAASTSATAASTSAGNASTSATNASNSATTAAGHAATASTSATNAANSATAAGGSATAAAGSASTASTQATNAGNSATAAAASAVAAASSATGAAGSASAASTSASTATTQATNAATSATAASTSATNAATSAGAASTSATNASTSATTASGHAATASSQATNAANSATAAAGSATAASGSASTASTQATNAGTSATAAAASLVSAQLVGAQIGPRDFATAAQWTVDYNTVPASAATVGSNATLATLGTYSGAQTVRLKDPGYGLQLGPKAFYPVTASDKIRVRAQVQALADASGTCLVRVLLQGFDAPGGGAFKQSVLATIDANLTVADGIVAFDQVMTVPAGGSTWFVPLVTRSSTGAPTVEVISFIFDNVTSSEAAAGSATAAATSASSAATSASGASTSASAASTSATNAATSAGAASTSATSASNSATTAAGHAATASTQATNAATSATAAAGSATAASGSASTASTQATNAGNSATAAAASAVTAASQATNAATSATAAATSASSAATSASGASTSASAAATSATNASTSAGAASTSATSASNSATTASGHAATASTEATNAANSATAAAGSASAASGSASSASTSATNASNSATAAASSSTAATSTYSATNLVAAQVGPRDFATAGQWTTSYNTAPASALSAGAGGSNSSLGTYSGAQTIRLTDPGYGVNLGPKAFYPVTSGDKIRVRARVQALSNASGTCQILAVLQGFDAPGGGTFKQNVSAVVDSNLTVADGIVSFDQVMTVPAAGSTWFVPLISRSTTGAPTVEVISLIFDNVTASEAAATSATAAATSASSAATSASGASTSASAASMSATNAATSAGAASTSATNASNSATTASGHAATASTQATNAANSASAAAGSATAASGSASTASTQATNASTSASAAATSATNAATSAGAASTSATSASGSATTAAGHAATASTQATNAATSATAAAGSATAASGSASTASTQATNASNSATAATASSVSAQSVANRVIPERPSTPADFVNSNSAGAPDTATPLASGANATVTGEGVVREWTGGEIVLTRGVFAVGAGKTFRLNYRTRVTADGTDNRAFSRFVALDASFGYLGDINAGTDDTACVVADGWQNFQRETTSTAILAAQSTAAYVRAGMRNGRNAGNTSSGATWQLAYLRFTDVTSEAAAASSATAAATSASNASTSASGAATSASAASTSATTASTQASNASTSATNASTSATNAASSASAASTSATAAATSAAGASTSAGTATTQASAASASAAAASSSATLSATYASAAGINGLLTNAKFMTGVVSGIPNGWTDWTNASGGTQASRPGSSGAYVYTLAGGAGQDNGILQDALGGSTSAVAPARRYRVRASLIRTSGTLNGAGVVVQWLNAAGTLISSTNIGFANTANTSGVVSNAHDGLTSWDVPVTSPALAARARVYACSHNSGLSGGNTVANGITWYECDLVLEDYMSAGVQTNAGAIATISGAAAFWETVVSASGGDLAAVRLKAGASGAYLELISSVLRLANITNGSVIEVMRAVGGEAFFSRPISSDSATRRLTVGPGYGVSGQEVVLWFGPVATAPSAQSRTNGYFALGTDGKIYFGAVDASLVASPLTSTFSPTYIDTTHASSTAFSQAVTVTPAGGSGTYTHVWEVGDVFSGNAPTLSNQYTATCTVNVTHNAIATIDGIIKCTTRDTVTGKQFVNYWSYYSQGTGGGGGAGGGGGRPP